MDSRDVEEILSLIKEAPETEGLDFLRKIDVGALPKPRFEEVIDALNDKMLTIGLKDNFEPNQFGADIDELIGYLVTKRIKAEEDGNGL